MLRQLLLLACLVLSAACQPAAATPVATALAPEATSAASAPPAAATPPSAPSATAVAAPTPAAVAATPQAHGPRNLIVYTAPTGGLTTQDLTNHSAQTLLPASAKEFYDGPTFAPDGSRIVFVYSTFDPANNPVDEIRSVDVDGANMRTLFRSSASPVPLYFSNPAFSADGLSIYFATLNPAVRDNKFQIVRGSVDSGRWTPVLNNAFLPAFSRDGKSMAFMRANLTTFLPSLWLANADGSAARELLADNVFLDLSGLRFTPDSKWIAFAASGPPSKKLPTAYVPAEDACALRLLFLCLATRAAANGLPWEIWLASADGKGFRQLTRLQLDSPWPAFSKDGREVAFMTYNGTFEIERETNRVSKLSDEGGHGAVDWFQN